VIDVAIGMSDRCSCGNGTTQCLASSGSCTQMKKECEDAVCGADAAVSIPVCRVLHSDDEYVRMQCVQLVQL
jgi:hypothetical protein